MGKSIRNEKATGDITEALEHKEVVLINEETIREKVYLIRGQKVMLDYELARIYGYTTTRFNEQVKNNIEKFDDDFMFQLTKEEMDYLMSKKSISSWGGRRKSPRAFTEQGIYMLMTVLRGDLATRQSKALIRTFKKMKDYILDNQDVVSQRDYLHLALHVDDHTRKLGEMNVFLNKLDNAVAEIMDQLGDVVKKSELVEIIEGFRTPELQKEFVLFEGKSFDADLAYDFIYRQAKRTLYVIDNYIGLKTLALLKNVKSDVRVILFSDNVGNGLHAMEYGDFRRQYPQLHIQLKQTGRKYHDRYIVLDYGYEEEKIFHCGPSSKDAGVKIASIVELRETAIYHPMIDELLKTSKLELS